MKKIQKQYERKVKVNQNNDAFTTFQRHSRQEQSPNLGRRVREEPKEQHENIQTLKSTLKSLMPVSMEITRQFSRLGPSQVSQQQQQCSQDDEYMSKLDQLTRNLQLIASKCHFSSSSLKSSSSKHIPQLTSKPKPSIQKSQLISRHKPIINQQIYRNTNISLQLPVRNHSFVDKEVQRNISNSKSVRKNQASLKEIRSNTQDLWRGSNERKRSSTKKEVIQGFLNKEGSHSKNLVKIFQSYQGTSPLKTRDRSRSLTKRYETVYQHRVHRHEITGILVTDHVYTSSLDRSIKKIYEKDGGYNFDIVQTYRGGVEHINTVNGQIYGCGRDYYLRSLSSDYFYRCESVPLSICQSDRSNQINLTLLNHQLRLFDIEKRQSVCSLQFEGSFAVMGKMSRQLFVGVGGVLFGVDWRKRDYLVSLFKEKEGRKKCRWMSDPFTRSIWTESGGEVTVLTQEFRKVKSKPLPSGYDFVTNHWGKNGLYVLARKDANQRLLKMDEYKEPQEVDSISEGQVKKLLIRQKQLFYGCKDGLLIVKQCRK